MDTQTIFNLCVVAVVFGSTIESFMRIIRLAKTQHKNLGTETVYVILGALPILIGLLVLVILIFTEYDFMAVKFFHLFGL